MLKQIKTISYNKQKILHLCATIFILCLYGLKFFITNDKFLHLINTLCEVSNFIYFTVLLISLVTFIFNKVPIEDELSKKNDMKASQIVRSILFIFLLTVLIILKVEKRKILLTSDMIFLLIFTIFLLNDLIYLFLEYKNNWSSYVKD